jgi:O-methyltransferase
MKQALRFLRNCASSSPNQRLDALATLSLWLFKDYRLTWPQMEWWNDADFNDYLRRFGEERGFNTHRKWALWQLLRLTTAVEGDTAECGVFEGASSWLICTSNADLGRKHHLFDSFEGISAPGSADGTFWRRGDLSASEVLVARNLAPFVGSIEFHRGWIPTRFADVSELRFSFVHIDVDLFQPTRDSISFFYDRMNPGAVVLCDDYAFSTCPGATRAIDAFLADKPEKMLSLPDGGGFFIKGCVTAQASQVAHALRVATRE